MTPRPCIVPGCPEVLEGDDPCPLHPKAIQPVSTHTAAEMLLSTMTRDEARRALYEYVGADPSNPNECVSDVFDPTDLDDDAEYNYFMALMAAAIGRSFTRKVPGPEAYHTRCLDNPPCPDCKEVQ